MNCTHRIHEWHTCNSHYLLRQIQVAAEALDKFDFAWLLGCVMHFASDLKTDIEYLVMPLDTLKTQLQKGEYE